MKYSYSRKIDAAILSWYSMSNIYTFPGNRIYRLTHRICIIIIWLNGAFYMYIYIRQETTPHTVQMVCNEFKMIETYTSYTCIWRKRKSFDTFSNRTNLILSINRKQTHPFVSNSMIYSGDLRFRSKEADSECACAYKIWAFM